MNVQELTTHAKAGQIDELNLISLEGGIYLLEARMHGKVHVLHDKPGHAIHLRSVEHARQMLQLVPVLPFHLIHKSVHDEMCGLGDSAEEDLKVPISFRATH
ncbi:MAG: DUF6482 family protein [Pseudomonas sp.]|uniref:DUF6482 family protein n=1 Tax=Pseudomonas abieticivorans TaxID=2931382 RepID=UPI0020BF4E57|nr:DUF6482 family protein [Pseudomonas sp. PIA16]MDE1168212.1 DUF6482 family protein [Pseudomonas sp.]